MYLREKRAACGAGDSGTYVSLKIKVPGVSMDSFILKIEMFVCLCWSQSKTVNQDIKIKRRRGQNTGLTQEGSISLLESHRRAHRPTALIKEAPLSSYSGWTLHLDLISTSSSSLSDSLSAWSDFLLFIALVSIAFCFSVIFQFLFFLRDECDLHTTAKARTDKHWSTMNDSMLLWLILRSAGKRL